MGGREGGAERGGKVGREERREVRRREGMNEDAWTGQKKEGNKKKVERRKGEN